MKPQQPKPLKTDRLVFEENEVVLMIDNGEQEFDPKKMPKKVFDNFMDDESRERTHGTWKYSIDTTKKKTNRYRQQ